MSDPIIIERENPGALDFIEFETPAELNRYFWNAAKKKGSPKLSIAVMSHRNLETLRICVDCVLRFTQDIDCELVLMDNASEDGGETFDYLMSVPHKRKKVIKMQDNMGPYFNAARGWSTLWGHCEGDYILHLNDDHFITENAVQNMIRALDSDITIGMVNPKSSSAWMGQDPGLVYNNIDEMFTAAKAFNVYDPGKWEERIYCAAVAWMFRKELRYCMECVYPFGPELCYDIAMRLAGYRVMLLGDTWVHHHHDYTKKESYGFAGEAEEKVRQREYMEQSTSRIKFGLSMFGGICVFERELAAMAEAPVISGSPPSLLAIHVRAGQGLLDLKNALRKYGVYNTKSMVFETEAKYYPLLYTVADEIILGGIDSIGEILAGRTFDYCLLGPPVTAYTYKERLLSALANMLNPGGQLLIKLEPDVTAFTELADYLTASCGVNISSVNLTQWYYVIKAIKP
ncbi:MAG: glycosyltransferase [Clostridiales bacterium]|jgi:glycosyltransferase involved in cell wall biosynthesis|nr:glycosyltransferase [Clostridiales bacterium]